MERTRELAAINEELKQEITERKRTEEALRESEERLRRYFELGLVGLAITSLTKGFLEVNNQLCEMLGYERSELSQMTWAELTHPDDLAADVAQFNRILAGEYDGYTSEKRYLRKDGQVIHATIAVKCVRRADGAINYFVALVQDITERKRTEEQLGLNEERFRVALQSSPIRVFNHDRDLRYTWVYNPTSGASEGLVGKTDAELFLPEYATSLMKLKRQIMESGVGVRQEISNLIGGQIHYYDFTGEPLRDLAGQVIGLTCARVDITERKRAEEAQRATSEQLRALSASLRSAREEEGTRIARELHDELGSALTSLKWELREH